VKQNIKEKYDVNQKDSDDSSDEEVRIRTGNVPEHWYDLYDHQGYSVDGKPVEKAFKGGGMVSTSQQHNPPVQRVRWAPLRPSQLKPLSTIGWV